MNAPPLLRSFRQTLHGPMPTARGAWRLSMAARPAQLRPLSSGPTTASASTSASTNASTNASTTATSTSDAPMLGPDDELPDTAPNDPRLPRSVQALYLQPLRRECEYGVPSADLQLRSYTLPGLKFFSDFALRAAYYLGLPAFGPTPLPRIIERWTVPRSHFIFKKSQENYERITLRRLIQIRDGHPETVQLWLAYLQKHAYPGLGMKANIYEFDGLDVAQTMDATAAGLSGQLEAQFAHLGEGKLKLPKVPFHAQRGNKKNWALSDAEYMAALQAAERPAAKNGKSGKGGQADKAAQAEEILSGSPEFMAALKEAKEKLAKDRQDLSFGF